MKNGNLFQELKTAKKEKRITYAKTNEIQSAYEKELEEAIKPIREKYKPILNKLTSNCYEKNENIWHIGGKLCHYGEFKVFDIVNVIADFLTYVEDEKFIPYANLDIYHNSIIVKEDIIKQYGDITDYETLDKLYKNGDLVILCNEYSGGVRLYNNIGNPRYSFGKYSYLYEFFNRLIQYKIDNNKDELSLDELYSFMYNYINNHPELSDKNKENYTRKKQ